MDIIIAAVGRGRRAPEQVLFETYMKRLPWAWQLVEIPVSKAATSARRKAEEAQKLRHAVANCEICMALDETGKNIPSQSFAILLQEQRDLGIRKIGFLIGGPDGHDDSARQVCQRTLSFGTMTWPHMLARAMLAEQLFRAYTIVSNHPYHRAGTE